MLRSPTAGVLIAVFAAVAIATVLVQLAAPTGESGDRLGSQDFVAYWSGFEVAADGGNPYAESELAPVQDDLDLAGVDETQRFWNPPWSLLLLAPVLVLPFDWAVSLWLVVSVVAALAASILGWRLLRGPEPLPPLALAASLLFVPLFESLLLGQLSALMAATVLATVVMIKERRDVAAGLLLGVVAMKPQTFVPLLVVLAVYLVWTRRWTVLRVALAGFGGLVLVSWLLLPSAYGGWDPVGGAPAHWHTASLAGWLRAALEGPHGVPTWPLAVVPAVGTAAVLAWMWSHLRPFDWTAVPALLAISYLVSPYAWLFDATVLIVVQVVVLGDAMHGRRGTRWLAGALAGTFFVGLWSRSLDATQQHHMVWIPMALAVIALLEHRLGEPWSDQKSDEPAEPTSPQFT